MLKEDNLKQVEKDHLLRIVLVVDCDSQCLYQTVDNEMNHLRAQLGVLADRANQKLHELTGRCVYDLSLLIELFAEDLDILTHNELKG